MSAKHLNFKDKYRIRFIVSFIAIFVCFMLMMVLQQSFASNINDVNTSDVKDTINQNVDLQNDDEDLQQISSNQQSETDNKLIDDKQKETSNAATDGTKLAVAEFPQADDLKFIAKQNNSSITFKTLTKDGLMYSKNGSSYSTYNGDLISLNNGEYVNFKANSVTTNDKNHFEMTGSIEAAGAISSLGTMSDCCYMNMFYDCSSLLSSPNLPSEKLFLSCYHSMFSGCTSLITAPSLPAINLEQTCYAYMFRGCSSLSSIPQLTAKKLPGSCYMNMFADSGVTNIGDLKFDDVADQSCLMMFSNCTKLKSIGNISISTSVGNQSFYQTFCGCANLLSVGNFSINSSAIFSSFAQMFMDCLNLYSVGSIFCDSAGEESFRQMFRYCSSLCNIPCVSFNSLGKSSCSLMFEYCISLENPPQLPCENLADSCYFYMFNHCIKLLRAPELPATTLAKSCYGYMFYNCIKLLRAPELPATTLAPSCYDSMFLGCSSLVSLPDLKATTNLEYSCYTNMFNNCLSIKLYENPTENCVAWSIPTPPSLESPIRFENMFKGTSGDNTYNVTTPKSGTTYYLSQDGSQYYDYCKEKIDYLNSLLYTGPGLDKKTINVSDAVKAIISDGIEQIKNREYQVSQTLQQNKDAIDLIVADTENNVFDQRVAESVINLINAIPQPVTLDSEAAIVAARNAYNALTDSQKGRIDAATYQKLLDAETALANLKDSKLKGVPQTSDSFMPYFALLCVLLCLSASGVLLFRRKIDAY